MADSFICSSSEMIALVPSDSTPEEGRCWERDGPDSCTEKVALARNADAELFSVMDNSARSPLVKVEEM